MAIYEDRGGSLLSELAPGKVNLVLEVGRRRSDGYHELATVFQSIGLYDRLTIKESADRSVQLEVSGADLPVGRGNLAVRAAQVLAAITGRKQPGVHIHLEKRIPVAAGLGGGSSDAAAVLRALAKLWRIKDEQALQEAAVRLGSDVPFFLKAGSAGATALGYGRGEVLSRVRVPPLWLVLANPGQGCSTRQVYELLAERRRREAEVIPEAGSASKRFLQVITEQGVKVAGKYLQNDMAEAAMALVPEIRRLLTVLIEAGAAGAQVSGSGATVFAVAEDAEHASRLAEAISSEAAWSWYGPTIGATGEVHPVCRNA